MAIFNCPECSKNVSDQATACPNCGNPVSKKNTAFEECIDKYKNNGYKIVKRTTNSVKLTSKIQDPKSKRSVRFLCIFIIALWTTTSVFYSLQLYSIMFGFGIATLFISVGTISTWNKLCLVDISITATGKIEEIGNVLNHSHL